MKTQRQNARAQAKAQTMYQMAAKRLLLAAAMAMVVAAMMMATKSHASTGVAPHAKGVTVSVLNKTNSILRIKVCDGLGGSKGKVQVCLEYTIKPNQTKRVSCVRDGVSSCSAQIHFGGTVKRQTLSYGHYYVIAESSRSKK